MESTNVWTENVFNSALRGGIAGAFLGEIRWRLRVGWLLG